MPCWELWAEGRQRRECWRTEAVVRSTPICFGGERARVRSGGVSRFLLGRNPACLQNKMNATCTGSLALDVRAEPVLNIDEAAYRSAFPYNLLRRELRGLPARRRHSRERKGSLPRLASHSCARLTVWLRFRRLQLNRIAQMFPESANDARTIPDEALRNAAGVEK
jgi:hypothetical protein